VVKTFSPQAQAAGVSLAAALPEMPAIMGDGDHLAQVFGNLLDNAIKFTPPGGSVLLSLETRPGSVLARVVDSGPGIASEDQQRVFERFYQVEKSRSGGPGRGFGLGLAITRQIVLAHGGEIWVESQPGQGSCFMVKLPLAQAYHQTTPEKGRGKR
jgi:signal transduction histidine kinase